MATILARGGRRSVGVLILDFVNFVPFGVGVVLWIVGSLMPNDAMERPWVTRGLIPIAFGVAISIARHPLGCWKRLYRATIGLFPKDGDEADSDHLPQ